MGKQVQYVRKFFQIIPYKYEKKKKSSEFCESGFQFLLPMLFNKTFPRSDKKQHMFVTES